MYDWLNYYLELKGNPIVRLSSSLPFLADHNCYGLYICLFAFIFVNSYLTLLLCTVYLPARGHVVAQGNWRDGETHSWIKFGETKALVASCYGSYFASVVIECYDKES